MLNPKSLGLAGGVIWGTFSLIWTIIAFLVAQGEIDKSVLAVGIVMAAIVGFICGFVTFFLLAWLYNKFNKGG